MRRFRELNAGDRFTLWGDRWQKLGTGAIELATNRIVGLSSLNPYCRDVVCSGEHADEFDVSHGYCTACDAPIGDEHA